MDSTCCGLNVMKFRLPSWIQPKRRVVIILKWCRNAKSSAKFAVSSWKWYLGDVMPETLSAAELRLFGVGLAQPRSNDIRHTNGSQRFCTVWNDAWLISEVSIERTSSAKLRHISFFKDGAGPVCWSAGDVDVRCTSGRLDECAPLRLALLRRIVSYWLVEPDSLVHGGLRGMCLSSVCLMWLWVWLREWLNTVVFMGFTRAVGPHWPSSPWLHDAFRRPA